MTKQELKYVNSLKAEIERLKEEIELLHSDYTYKLVKKKSKAEAYKEVFEKVEERLAVHSFTSNSTEYSDGVLDCIEWVDSKLDELKKEMVGESIAENS